MTGDALSVLRVETAVKLVNAIKGDAGYVILRREPDEIVDGLPSSVITFENIETGVIYSLPYQVEDLGDGTTRIHLVNGGVQLEGHGDLMYTPVTRLSDVPDTIESLFKDS